MGYTIIPSPCGCISIRQEYLRIGNSNLIPSTDLYVDKFTFNFNIDYEINKIFSTQNDFLNYLNDTFVELISPSGKPFRGTFGFDNISWYYTNEELFNVCDIFMNYGLKQLYFQIGSPSASTLELPPTDTYTNGITEFSHQELFNMQEVSVRIGNIDSEPIVSTGHTYTSIDPMFALNGKIEFPYPLYDTYVYVTLTQKPA